MKCPICKSENSPNTELCSCGGYNFKYRLESPIQSADGDKDMPKDAKYVFALLLGVFSFFLMFLLGEGVTIPSSVPGAKYIELIIFIGGMCGFFLISAYFLLRGNPQAIWKNWPVILNLNLILLLTAVIALVFEPNKLAALGILGIAIVAVACSYAGAALAARVARR
jgi:hypothetical protein